MLEISSNFIFYNNNLSRIWLLLNNSQYQPAKRPASAAETAR